MNSKKLTIIAKTTPYKRYIYMIFQPDYGSS